MMLIKTVQLSPTSPVFFNQWSSYHQWYLKWCLVVLTGPQILINVAAREGTQYNKQH